IIGCLGIIQPIVVGEPRVLVRYRYQFTGTPMVEVISFFAFLIQNLLYSRSSLKQLFYFRNVLLLINVNMSYLMVSYCKSLTGTGIKRFQAQFVLYHNISFFP